MAGDKLSFHRRNASALAGSRKVSQEKRYLGSVLRRFQPFFREATPTILQWRAESYFYIS